MEATASATQQEGQSKMPEKQDARHHVMEAFSSLHQMRGQEEPGGVCWPNVVCCETNQLRMNVYLRNIAVY